MLLCVENFDTTANLRIRFHNFLFLFPYPNLFSFKVSVKAFPMMTSAKKRRREKRGKRKSFSFPPPPGKKGGKEWQKRAIVTKIELIFGQKKAICPLKKSFGISMSFLTEKRNWPVSFEARRGHTSSGSPPPKKKGTKKFFSSHKTPQEINSAGVPSYGFSKRKKADKKWGENGPSNFLSKTLSGVQFARQIYIFFRERGVRAGSNNTGEGLK